MAEVKDKVTKKFKFRLLRGTHQEGRGKDAVTYQATRSKKPIIHTDLNLAKMFGADKFAKVKGASDPDEDEEEDEEEDEDDEVSKFEGMSVAKLKKYATANEIDLGDATKKADIIYAIQLAEESGGE